MSVLAYNETSIPGASLLDRLQLAASMNLALEVANNGNFQIELYQQCAVAALQAYAMHEFHPLHRNSHKRQQAFEHVCETLEIAALLNVPRIVTICGYGHEIADHPFERCLAFFNSLIAPARNYGIRIMIEPLSPLKVGALNHPNDIIRLLNALNAPSIFSLMLDTGHLLDSGIDLNNFFAEWKYPIEELQLKGLQSAPPTLDMAIQTWLSTLPQLPEVVCIEHRQPINTNNFIELTNSLKSVISDLQTK